MGIVEAAGAAQKGMGDETSSLSERFQGALERFEPGCDADAVANGATAIRAEAIEAAGAIEDLMEFLRERLADARSLEEKADRLADDAHSRYYGPDTGPDADTEGVNA